MKPARFPHSLVLIFAMIVVAHLATYLLPAGQYEREGRSVIPGTYQVIEAEPGESTTLPWHASLSKILKGMKKGADVIFFVFLVGGVIAVLRATGAIDALIGAALHRLGGRPILLVAGMTTLFAVGSSTIGMAEEYMPFIPILVTMCLALKLDALVAMGIVYVGAGIGYGCAAMNPFTVMIAQDISGLPPTSGQGFRWLLLGLCLVVGIHHIMRYVGRVRADARNSLVGDVDYASGYEMPEDVALTGRRIGVLAVFVAAVAVFVYGVKFHDWYFTELSATFLAVGLLSAVIGGVGVNATAQKFCEGAAEMTTTALLIGFARTIEVVLEDALVIDTVIHGVAGFLDNAGPNVAAVGMLGVQSLCNLFVPSGSGQAYVTMPIMAPLAGLTGVPAQTAVLAYQFGDGFTNMIVPTNGLLMGMLALGRIPYQRWLRFILPLMVKLYLLAILALIVAVKIGY